MKRIVRTSALFLIFIVLWDYTYYSKEEYKEIYRSSKCPLAISQNNCGDTVVISESLEVFADVNVFKDLQITSKKEDENYLRAIAYPDYSGKKVKVQLKVSDMLLQKGIRIKVIKKNTGKEEILFQIVYYTNMLEINTDKLCEGEYFVDIQTADGKDKELVINKNRMTQKIKHYLNVPLYPLTIVENGFTEL